jgi:hypothetical protein
MAETYTPPTGDSVGLTFDGEYLAPFGDQVWLPMPEPDYLPPRGDSVALPFEDPYTPPAGDSVALTFGSEPPPLGEFSISSAARITLIGDAPIVGLMSISAPANITVITKTPAASAGFISAGTQITLNGQRESSSTLTISVPANLDGNALVQRTGVLSVSDPLTINLIGKAPVLPNLPTLWAYVCADPEIKVYSDQYDLCSDEPDPEPELLTSTPYPVQILDRLQGNGQLTDIRVGMPPMDFMQATGDVASIELVDRVIYSEYLNWPVEELQASGEITSIQLITQVGYVEYSHQDELEASGDITSIALSPPKLIHYQNWPVESIEASGDVISIELKVP